MGGPLCDFPGLRTYRCAFHSSETQEISKILVEAVKKIHNRSETTTTDYKKA